MQDRQMQNKRLWIFIFSLLSASFCLSCVPRKFGEKSAPKETPISPGLTFDSVFPKLQRDNRTGEKTVVLWSGVQAKVTRFQSNQSVNGSLANNFIPFEGDELTYRQVFLNIEMGKIESVQFDALKKFYGGKSTASYQSGKSYHLETFLGPNIEALANRLARDSLSKIESVTAPSSLLQWNNNDGFFDCRATAYSLLENVPNEFVQFNAYNNLPGIFDPRFYDMIFDSKGAGSVSIDDAIANAKFGDIVLVGMGIHVATIVERGIVFDKDAGGQSPFRFFYLQDTLNHYKNKLAENFSFQIVRPRMTNYPRAKDMLPAGSFVPRVGFAQHIPHRFANTRTPNGALQLQLPGTVDFSVGMQTVPLKDLPNHVYGIELAEAWSKGFVAGCAKDKFCSDDPATLRLALIMLSAIYKELNPTQKFKASGNHTHLTEDVQLEAALVEKYDLLPLPPKFEPSSAVSRITFSHALSKLIDVITQEKIVPPVAYITPFVEEFPDMKTHPQRAEVLALAQFCASARRPAKEPLGQFDFKPDEVMTRADLVGTAMRFLKCASLAKVSNFDAALNAPYIPKLQ